MKGLKMDNSRIVFLINDTARAVMATYEDRGTPEMFKTLDATIGVGDLVAVQSTTRHNVTICKVTMVDVDVNFDATTPLKWIVSRLDMDAFDKILAGEAQAVSVVQAAELKRKKEELRKTMFANHEDSISALALTSQSGGDITE
jgi:predicted Mrr-cat superfamily restriction endonuclease